MALKRKRRDQGKQGSAPYHPTKGCRVDLDRDWEPGTRQQPLHAHAAVRRYCRGKRGKCAEFRQIEVLM
eukprot:scaffold15486_cov111-Isochrysis_galbana.AAC.3